MNVRITYRTFSLKISFDLKRLMDVLRRLSRRAIDYSMTLLDRWKILLHL